MLKPKLLQLAQLGHPVLRQKAVEITNFKSKELQKLIDDLIATVGDVDGVGIAAPQVYESKRVFIVASYPNPRYPNAPKMKPTAMINPIIIKNSEETEKDWEGCLSLPGIRALVPRYKNIKVEFYTREGKKQTKTFKDFIASIFQHELDHLNGKVFTDRADPKDFMMEKEYQKMMKVEAKPASTGRYGVAKKKKKKI